MLLDYQNNYVEHLSVNAKIFNNLATN